MDDQLADLAAQGYDVANDPRRRARRRRRHRLALVVGGLLVLALGLGGVVGLDRVDRHRAEGVLPDLAAALQAQVGQGEAGRGGPALAEIAATFLEDPAVDLPDVGTYLLADPASREEPLSACVQLEPRLGTSSYSCVPLAEPDAEPTSPEGGMAFFVVGPE
ncbi:hypothetical protein [Nocardioides salarius]|uniref:hypothetical protein n=1 Tax=Nocardioides salarius TaxID=374513 RepID=UPI0030F91A83